MSEALTQIGVVGATCAAVLLVVAGLNHLRDLQGVRAVMRSHGVVPGQWISSASLMLPIVELVTAVWILSSMLGIVEVSTIPAVGSVCLYVLFALYSAVVGRIAPMAPCGCGLGGGTVGWWTTSRACLVAVLLVAHLIWPSRLVDHPETVAHAVSLSVILAVGSAGWEVADRLLRSLEEAHSLDQRRAAESSA